MARKAPTNDDEEITFELRDTPETIARNEEDEFQRRREETQGGWVEIRENPSGTKFYKLRGTPLKIYDRKVLAHITDNNASDIIDSCIRTHIHGVQLEEMLYQERKWLVFWLRFYSFANTSYDISWKCLCGKSCSTKIDIGDFKVIKPDDSLNLTGNRIKLKSGKSASFRMETFELHYQINDFWKTMLERNNVINDAEKAAFFEMAYMAGLLEEYDGKKFPGFNMEGFDFIDNLNVNDCDEMFQYVDKTLTGWGVSSKVQVTCEKCGGSTALAVNFRGDVFVSKN